MLTGAAYTFLKAPGSVPSQGWRSHPKGLALAGNRTRGRKYFLGAKRAGPAGWAGLNGFFDQRMGPARDGWWNQALVEKHGNDVRRRRREPGDMLDVPWLFAGVRWGAEALRTVGRARHRFSLADHRRQGPLSIRRMDRAGSAESGNPWWHFRKRPEGPALLQLSRGRV